MTIKRTDTAATVKCNACGHSDVIQRQRTPERSAQPDAADVTRPASAPTRRD